MIIKLIVRARGRTFLASGKSLLVVLFQPSKSMGDASITPFISHQLIIPLTHHNTREVVKECRSSVESVERIGEW